MSADGRAAAPPRALAPQPRADGHARVSARLRDGRSRLCDLFERGSAKARVPNAYGPALDAVFLNTAGGVTGGDRFRYEATAEAGATLTVSTQAAERGYRAQPGETGRIETRLRIAPGARLDWLPQETILFDRSALHRRIEIAMAEDATLLFLEPVVFGREAMGETVTQAAFRDSQRLRRGGRLVYADSTRVEGPVAEILARPACLAGARAYATLIYAAPDAESRLTEARDLLRGAEAGASAFDGLISARIVSPDGYALRRTLAHFLRGFRAAPLPRVWEM